MKKLLIAVIVLIVFCAAAYGATINYLHKPLADSQGQTPLLLVVEPGDSARVIVAKINRHWQRPANRIDYRLSQVLIGINQIKTGAYEIHPQHTWFTVWEKLARGEEKQFAVTLVEGQTLRQWVAKLQQQPFLKKQLAGNDLETLQAQLDFVQDYPSPEGLFLPETYHYTAFTSDYEVLKRAYHAMQQPLQEIWQQRSAECPVDSPYELLILASIIEKETGQDGERAMVAGVFANRLEIGMRLQSDPTTIYGIPDFDGNLTRIHLRAKTPFNTYRINGLPPTPIAMVSPASLKAAAHPASSDYFYFVADKKGGHVFSETLEQHRRAVRKYQLNQ
ncbi:endolytic transglycosylase MltG [Idiomarina seosinensis]|uniref:endolytic transglycosylase MltG n=1 Tax=Idiomarina seosinensis TaxID=281739 RepID=UPI00384EF5D6